MAEDVLSEGFSTCWFVPGEGERKDCVHTCLPPPLSYLQEDLSLSCISSGLKSYQQHNFLLHSSGKERNQFLFCAEDRSDELILICDSDSLPADL